MQTNHDHKKAIETAKKEFRRNPGPDSRRALFSAYIARIDELEKRGELTAASELKDSLSSRFPEHKDELLQLFFSYKAGAGSPFENALIAFLNDSPDSPSYRSSVENLGSIIVNPEQLSLSTLLPADHALKCQAQTLMRAFSAVTTHGNGADLQLLHELKSTIDRHSPLFAWRRATMALYAFYCGETAEMQKHLAGIDSRHPVGAIATALNSLAGVAPFPAEHPSYAGFAGLEKELNATLPPELREQLDQIFATAVDHNIRIGKFTADGFSNLPAGNKILCTLELDLNGILHVTVVEKATGLSKRVRIENALGAMAGKDLDNARANLDGFFGPNRPQATENERSFIHEMEQLLPKHAEAAAGSNDNEPSYKVKARQLLARAMAARNAVTPEDLAEYETLTAGLSSSLENGSETDINAAVRELDNLLYFIEEA